MIAIESVTQDTYVYSSSSDMVKERGLLDLEIWTKNLWAIHHSIIYCHSFLILLSRKLNLAITYGFSPIRAVWTDRKKIASMPFHNGYFHLIKQRNILFYYRKTPTCVAEYSKRNAFCNRAVDTKQPKRRRKCENVNVSKYMIGCVCVSHRL